jgi:hypothetical protein
MSQSLTANASGASRLNRSKVFSVRNGYSVYPLDCSLTALKISILSAVTLSFSEHGFNHAAFRHSH